MDAAEKEKIAKHKPPENKSKGGEGRKSHKMILKNESTVAENTKEAEHEQTNWIRKVLGYEKVNKETGEIRYKKEPKYLFFMIVELLIKIVLVLDLLVASTALFLYFGQGLALQQLYYVVTFALPVLFWIVFHYIRRSKMFTAVSLIAMIESAVTYYLIFGWQIPMF